MPKTAKDVVIRMGSTAHRGLYRVSGGRLGGRLWSLPVVMLTTTGRRSGRTRTVPLTGVPVGERVILIASNGGQDHHPGWFLNLRASPSVTAEIEGGRRAMRAHVAAGDERAKLWDRAVGAYPGWGRYQQGTTRRFPVVVLAPESDAGGTPEAA